MEKSHFEKLLVTKLVNKVPIFHGNRRFTTVFTRDRIWSLSCATCIQSTASHPISLRSNLILSFHLRLRFQSDLFPSGSLIKILYAILISLMYVISPSYLILLDFIVVVISDEAYKLWGSSLCSVPQPPHFVSLRYTYPNHNLPALWQFL
jgi:hypothetical protein